MIRTNKDERQQIPDECVERFIHFGGNQERIWPHHEVDVAGLSRVVPGYLIERWAFPYHVVVVVTYGELEVSWHGGCQHAKAGDFIFMSARQKVTYHADQVCEIAWLHLLPGNQFWKAQSELDEVFVCPTRNALRLAQLMEFLYQENVVPQAGNSVIQQLLSQLILQYLREDLLEVVRGRSPRPRLEECFRFVGESPEHDWDVSALCRIAGMSRAAFFTACREQYGSAPMAVVRQIRLNAAARLLSTTDATLDAIAEQTGFDCGFSLSRAFKKEYGCAPGKWRKKIGGR